MMTCGYQVTSTHTFSMSDFLFVAESPARTNAEKLRATLNIAHALKVKISKEMHMLNHQLAMVENFELQVQGTEGVNQEDCSLFVKSLTNVLFEEEALCKEFRSLIHGQQQST